MNYSAKDCTLALFLIPMESLSANYPLKDHNVKKLHLTDSVAYAKISTSLSITHYTSVC